MALFVDSPVAEILLEGGGGGELQAKVGKGTKWKKFAKKFVKKPPTNCKQTNQLITIPKSNPNQLAGYRSG